MFDSPTILLALIALLGLFCQWFAWWVKLPAILFLLLSGIILGPTLGILEPNALLGELFFPLVSLSVAIILFEGSLSLNYAEIRGLAGVVRRLVSVGVLVTWIIMTLASHFLIGFSWSLSFIFGSLVVVTGPTVIVPMLRSVRPNSRISSVLRWEGIVIDPIGALLAVLVYETIISLGHQFDLAHTLVVFFKVLAFGGIIGVGSGYLLGLLLRYQILPTFLHNIGTIAFVLSAFALSNYWQEESGLLTVTIMGIWLANMRDVNVDDILSFKENLTILLISGLFILLAARIEFDQLLLLGWPALLILACMQFIARPAAVFLSTVKSDLSWQERTMIAWIGPRGIVAAAIAAFFAIQLEAAGFEKAPLLVSLTFIIIIGTVVLQSATSRLFANLLNVSEPASRGFLIVGANLVARELAQVLKDNEVNVLLTDTNWENIKEARMKGLDTFYGNPVSEFADTHLDLVGLGRLIGVSPQRELNALAAMRYRLEFGAKNIFNVPVISKNAASEKHAIATQYKGRTPFSSDLTYSKFTSLLMQKARIKSTLLTESFDFEQMKETNRQLYPLFAVNKSGRLYVFSEDEKLQLQPGWTVISLDYSDVIKQQAEPAEKD